MSEEIIVSTLTDFMKEMDKLSGDFYFRGEPKDYNETKNLASGYRWMSENNKTFQDLLQLREEYYREVGYQLSEKEEKNFIAYAQHHGLPTELLDITENPLVALYFACQIEKENDGFVYGFDNAGVLSIGKLLISTNIENQKYELLSDIEEYSEFIMEYLYGREKSNITFNIMHDQFLTFVPKILRIFKQSKLFNFKTPEKVKKEFEVYSNLIKQKYGSNLKKISRVIRFSTNDKEILKNRYCIEALDEEIVVTPEMLINKICSDETLYFKYLNLFLALTLINSQVDQFMKITFPPIFTLLHRPSIIFDRMINQQGLFFYQLNMEVLIYGTDIKYHYQTIEPSFKVRVTNDNKKEFYNNLIKLVSTKNLFIQMWII